MNRKVVEVLFAKMRLLGSNRALQQQSANILKILKESTSANDSKALALEFGFVDQQEFMNSTFVLFKRKAELQMRYANYDDIDRQLFQDAYSLAVKKIKPTAKASAAKISSVCVECFMNNCDECWGGSGGCNTCLDTPGNGGGGGNCNVACNNIRMASRSNAEVALMLELGLACPGVSYSVYEYLTQNGMGSQAGLGTAWTAVMCGGGAYLIYINNISIAENSYVTCLSGCK